MDDSGLVPPLRCGPCVTIQQKELQDREYLFKGLYKLKHTQQEAL